MKKCWICNSEMEYKLTTVKNGHGNYVAVYAFVCPRCGEIVFTAKTAIELEKMRKEKDIKNEV